MIKPSGLTNLSKWTDIIKSIDFFVSSPIYTYDQSGTVEAIGRRSSAEIFSHSGWSQRINATRTDNDDENHHRQPPTFDPDLIPQYKFIDGNTEQWLSQEKPSLVPPQFSREHIESGITSVANFYLISSLPLTGEDAISDLDAFTPLAINEKALSTFNFRPTLPDDWRSHEVIHFKTSYPYNSRLTLAGVSSSLFRGFSIPDMGQYWENHDSQDLNCTIWVKLIRNFKSYWISTTSSLPGGRLPRFLFYPDPSAVEMRVICEDGSGWQLPLTTHDFLNGSYWFDGLAKERTPKKDNVEAPIQSESIAEEPSKLFLSEVNNPFYFPVEGRISVGSGRILGISSSAKALSQGQFGQFPLYAFTTEGVWAMELSSTGTYTARQPISRDVCTNPDAITQIDSAVLFPTNRGIMLISGSQVQCISDIIDNPANINALNLPFLNRLHTMAGHDTDSCFPLVPFLEFVSGCGMIYDYIHQRIFIFNKAYNYAYVYSLKSQQWGMTFSRISHSVNSYPEAMAIDLDGNLVNFSKENTIRETGLLVTRPIKLDDRDILKTIQTVIQRGKFRKGHIKSVLYGSRDLYNWHMISSSKTHQLSGFSGSPYKFFRLALICNLAIDESLTGCTIQYNERLTNKLR